MDIAKLKLEQYASVKVIGMPDELDIPNATENADFDCLLAFVQTEEALNQALALVVAQTKTTGLIVAYPKGTSKVYHSEVNRDAIIAEVKKHPNIKAPRLVSLDKDWSGFSFRYQP